MLESKIKRGYGAQDTIIHSDQGSIYSSVALSQVHKDYNIIRSIIESKKGWLKKEIAIDFQEENYETAEDYIKDIIHDHNYVRESYALQYKTPS